MLPSYLHLGIQSALFHSGFPAKIFYTLTPAAGSCEHGNEPLHSIKGGKFLD
jgi:hypothetical protein